MCGMVKPKKFSLVFLKRFLGHTKPHNFRPLVQNVLFPKFLTLIHTTFSLLRKPLLF